jgi:hypothetical protein
LSTSVLALWGHAGFELYVRRLIMDSGHGKRQVLPWDAAQELLFLVELSIAKRALMAAALTGAPVRQEIAPRGANCGHAGSAGPDMADRRAGAAAQNGAGRAAPGQDIPKRGQSVDYRWESEKTWWRRLFG